MIRVLLDVNVVVSAIIAPMGTPRQVLGAWQSQRFAVVISEGIIAIIEEKLRSPKIGLAYRVTDDDVHWLRALLHTQAEMVVVLPGDVAGVTGDPEDDYVLATGAVGKADYLVTGDRRLLALGVHGATRIISPREMWERLQSG
jgi:hypothetical protein